MKTKFLLLFSFLASVILSTSVYAQQNPPGIVYFYVYSTNGQEYFGKYWPENTNISEAIAMDHAAKSDNPANMRLFEGCDLKLRISLSKAVRSDTTIYLKLRFNDYTSTGGVNTRAAVNLPDSIPIPSGVTYFEYPYKINHLPEAQNGGLARIMGYTTYPDGREYSYFADKVNFYNRFTYDIQTKWATHPFLTGVKLKIMGGSPQIVYSIDGGYTWKKPEDEEYIEFNDYEVGKIREVGLIYIKEPNSCHLETISVGKGSGSNGSDETDPSVIKRPVNLPSIANAIVSHPKGTYYISSSQHFSFTVTPTGANAGMVPVITTNRTIVPDSEGVLIEDNGDGSYTVTILYVQQTINVSVDFTTGNETIEDYNRVWTNNTDLYLSAASDDVAYIYNTAGTLIKTVSLQANETASLSLPTGFYIVKLNNRSHKVVLK